ncbi:hypothetical protein MVEG_08784 [Podila verticillata NRRL 6337]|nr:hypothetical protein MVEG_08784 [Podila verticillata NRRL 6337]
MIEVSKHSGDDSGTMRELRVSRNGYSWTFNWPDYVCKYGHDGRFRGIFFVCHDTGNNWCNANQYQTKEWCGNYLDMGSDSLSCHADRRPTP